MSNEEYDKRYADDAYKKYLDLIKDSTKEWGYRENLTITALAHQRCVMICTHEIDHTKARDDPHRIKHSHEVRKNIASAREFAQSILEACAFVEEKNPGWASQFPEGKVANFKFER